MVLLHAARRSAGAAGVDDAGEFVAADARDVASERVDVGLAASKLAPAVAM